MPIALASTGAVLSVIFHLAWKTQGRVAHARTWSFACVALTIQCCVSLASGWFPSVESYWVTLSAASLIVITLAIRGHCQRSSCQMLPGNLWPYAAFLLFVIGWFTYAYPHVGLRNGILPFAGAASLFLSTAMVLRHRNSPRPAEWATAAAMTLFGVAQLAAAFTAIMQGADGDVAYGAINRTINLVSLPVGYISVAMFSIFMLASDLSGQLREIAVRDQLTGLLNRRGFAEQATRAYATARRSGQAVAVIMADIDRFKFINDELGHAAGDVAICHVACIFLQDRRAEDILARMGGEEFALVLPGTDAPESMRIATELCREVEHTLLEYDGSKVSMTASFGVAAISDKDTCLADIVVRADQALYRSKRAGRNRVDLDSSQILYLQERSTGVGPV